MNTMWSHQHADCRTSAVLPLRANVLSRFLQFEEFLLALLS